MNGAILQEVKKRIIYEFNILYQIELSLSQIELTETRKDFNGDLTCIIFPFTRYSKKSPELTATELGNALIKDSHIKSFEVIKGFLNLSLNDRYLLEALESASLNPNYGILPNKGEKVMIEFSSPNTNKPLHLGHVRNNLLGYSVAEILKSSGYEVIKTCLVNDRGIHICKSMIAYQIWGDGETPESSGIKGDHLVGKYYVRFEKEIKLEIEVPISRGITDEEARNNAPLMLKAKKMLLDWENEVPQVRALWHQMNGWVYKGFEETYQKLGISFDRFYYESNTYLLGKDLIEEGLQKNVFFKKVDGSVWIDLTEDGLDQKLVLRSDGTSVYITQDLGTASLKFEDYKMQRSIHVVGNEQDYHFKVLFLILVKLGKVWAKGLYHLSYGMVDLPSGKMKSREGTVVDADDLLDQMLILAKEHSELLGKNQEMKEESKTALYKMIGWGALKYFLLRVDPAKRLLFDPKESIDLQGNTAPFIQYSYARVQSIFRKMSENEAAMYDSMQNFDPSLSINIEERTLMKHLLQYELMIEEASSQFSPALVCGYLFDLSKKFNHFYHLHPVLKEANIHSTAFRLRLCKMTSILIKRGMRLLGIEVPEKM